MSTLLRQATYSLRNNHQCMLRARALVRGSRETKRQSGGQRMSPRWRRLKRAINVNRDVTDIFGMLQRRIMANHLQARKRSHRHHAEAQYSRRRRSDRRAGRYTPSGIDWRPGGDANRRK